MSQRDTAVRTSVRRWEHLPVPVRRVVVRSRRLGHRGRPARPEVTVERRGDVAVITFDDRKVNVISRRSTPLLAGACERVRADAGVRAAVLAGRPGQFSAGFDLDTLMIGGADRDELFRTAWDMLRRYFTLPVPLVVACTGNAIAGGAALLLAGDVRVAARGEFRIGFNEAAIGLPLPGLLLMLAQDALTPTAFEPATAGARLYAPEDALDAGFVHRVVPPEQVVEAAVAEARCLAADHALVAEKRATLATRTARIESQLAADLELLTHLEGRPG